MAGLGPEGLHAEGAQPDAGPSVVAERASEPGESPAILRLRGELDTFSVASVRRELHAIVSERPDRLVVELDGLDFMDSSGIELLVEAARTIAIVELRNPSAIISRVIEATGLSGILRIVR